MNKRIIKISDPCHAVRLPFPRKAHTLSQPVSAWKNGKPNARGSSAFDIHLESLHLPKAIHNLFIYVS